MGLKVDMLVTGGRAGSELHGVDLVREVDKRPFGHGWRFFELYPGGVVG
jgi:hypothetical protein